MAWHWQRHRTGLPRFTAKAALLFSGLPMRPCSRLRGVKIFFLVVEPPVRGIAPERWLGKSLR
jgi:hypothetical protein